MVVKKPSNRTFCPPTFFPRNSLKFQCLAILGAWFGKIYPVGVGCELCLENEKTFLVVKEPFQDVRYLTVYL